jgi:hypothetical protein
LPAILPIGFGVTLLGNGELTMAAVCSIAR